MKRRMIPLLVLCSLALLAGCGKTGEVVDPETTAEQTTAEQTTAEPAAAEPAAEEPVTEAGNTVPEERDWDRIPAVMIDGVVYESTGYISSAIGCGNMDGEITSAVEGPELPTKDDQSNFGTGYMYQRSSEGQMVVVMNDMKVIFRDPRHSFASDMPEEVLNFNAEVLEVRNGSLLVSFISAPDLFRPPVTGQCVVRTNAEIMKDDVAVGDTVRVWFDGLIQELYPPILPNVYRVVKEEKAAEEERRSVLVNLGAYSPECEVPSAKVLVSVVDAAPSGATVCFDQYDNTVKAELLTGEYFVLEKKDGDQWTELEPVIENAAFSAVGILIQKGGITQKEYNWEWLYGKLQPGQYRIRVQVVDDTVHEAAARFTLRTGS